MFIFIHCTMNDVNHSGLWQVSGAHGYIPNKFESVADMSKYINSGFTSFDVADIYGPAGEENY